MLLCEIACGDQAKILQPDFSEKLGPVKNSKWALGDNFPDPKETKIVNGFEVPCGKLIFDQKVGGRGYNEFIVYDPA